MNKYRIMMGSITVNLVKGSNMVEIPWYLDEI